MGLSLGVGIGMEVARGRYFAVSSIMRDSGHLDFDSTNCQTSLSDGL